MSRKKVLVVDNEIHIVHVVSIKLRNNGYDVLSSENGVEAFELACREKPDIIVTDYQMPMMTGLELVRKLRENEATRNIPVIMLTARTIALEDGKNSDLEISAFLSKPFSPKELLRSIEDILYQNQLVAGIERQKGL
jgi:two-component system alkaline phosphatase synthesis response regulator PhoP